MLEIQVQLYSILREQLPLDAEGRAVLHFDEGVTLADLLNQLDISHRVVISVNEVHVQDKSHQLRDGDKVKIFPSISGG